MQNKRKFHRRSTYSRAPEYRSFRTLIAASVLTRRTYDRKFIFYSRDCILRYNSVQTELLEIFLFTGSHNCTGNDPRIIQDIATIERFVLLVFHFIQYGHDRTLVRSGIFESFADIVDHTIARRIFVISAYECRFRIAKSTKTSTCQRICHIQFKFAYE